MALKDKIITVETYTGFFEDVVMSPQRPVVNSDGLLCYEFYDDFFGFEIAIPFTGLYLERFSRIKQTVLKFKM